MLRGHIVRSILIACLFVVSTGPAVAQSTFATLTGTVTDSSGAVLLGVTITDTNIGTERARSVVTDDVGNYLVPNVDAGSYRIVAALSGFAEQTQQTELLARHTVRVALQLRVAGTREQNDMVGTAPVIETERATIDNSKSSDDINRLALTFRATTSTSPICQNPENCTSTNFWIL